MTEDVEYRTATALEVRHAERTIDLIAVPYNESTEVLIRGRLVTETVSPTAFAGVTGAVAVNRKHDPEQPLGVVRKFHPRDPRGLRTEVRISRTAAGNDVLELADDGLLSASIGFAVLPGGEQWSVDRRSRTVTAARLLHIALTGDPAYTGARVLAVRTTDERSRPAGPTPNLDRIRLAAFAATAGMTLSDGDTTAT